METNIFLSQSKYLSNSNIDNTSTLSKLPVHLIISENAILHCDLNANYRISIFLKYPLETLEKELDEKEFNKNEEEEDEEEEEEDKEDVEDNANNNEDQLNNINSDIILENNKPEEAVVIEIKHKSFKWKSFKGEFSNNKLDDLDYVWNEDNLKEKYDIIKSFLLKNKESGASDSFFTEGDKSCYLTIPYAMGNKLKGIKIKIDEDKEDTHLSIIKKLEECEKQRKISIDEFGNYEKKNKDCMRGYNEIKNLIERMQISLNNDQIQ